MAVRNSYSHAIFSVIYIISFLIRNKRSNYFGSRVPHMKFLEKSTLDHTENTVDKVKAE